MKTVQALAQATRNTKAGNHRVEIDDTGFNLGRRFYYYSTVICEAYDNVMKFKIDASYGSTSTTRACNAYRKYFLNLGYTEINAQTGEAV